ncbi:hypothetical protein AAG906_031689 [Vitis piasezkii]
MKLSYSKVDPWRMGSFNKKLKRKSMNPDLAGGMADGLMELAGKYQEWKSVWRHMKMRHSSSNLIQDINTRLAIIKQTKERYQIMVSTPVSVETNAYVNVRVVPLIPGRGDNTVGIDEPKRKLVSWALELNQNLKVMFVVGWLGWARQRLPVASSDTETAQFSPAQTVYGNDNRIIITTRRGDIANSCRDDDSIDIHKVQPLSPHWAEQLFYKKAFSGDGSCPSGLEEVSKSILQKCDGLPLGIIEIGRLLSMLSASYKDLPYHLKYCFLYMSIFPENNPYLNELIGRSLIKANEMDFDERPITVGVHSLMHRIILSVSQEENFCTVCARPEGNLADKPRAYPSRQETLMCSKHWFNFKLLKVLDIQSTPLGNFPSAITDLVLLRYLSLRNTNIRSIPKSLRNLRHLETLDLKQTLVTRGSRHQRDRRIEEPTKAIICKGEWAAQNDTRARQSYTVEEAGLLNKEEPLELDAMTNPPPLLQRLYLRGPLERIRLKWSLLSQDNPIEALQDLPNLMELQLLYAYTGTQLDFNSENFRNLEQLKQLRFIIVEDGTLPCLQKLIIRQCNELEHVPVGIDGLHHLNELHLCDMPEKFVAQLKKNGGQFRYLVHHIPCIHSYNQGQLEDLS